MVPVTAQVNDSQLEWCARKGVPARLISGIHPGLDSSCGVTRVRGDSCAGWMQGLAGVGTVHGKYGCSCSKIAEAEAVVSVNEKKSLEMHMYMHVQLMQ
jgi:hypothetical protein